MMSSVSATGVLQWAITLEEEGQNGVWLGVAVKSAMSSSDGRQSSYAFLYNPREGKTVHAGNLGSENLPTGKKGDIIQFQLNVNQDAENGGNLKASFDGGQHFFVLFKKLRLHLVSMEGFVPVAGIGDAARLRLLFCKQDGVVPES